MDLQESIAALTAERDRLKRECLDYESEIASVCQEDYSLKETFDAMVKQIDRHIAKNDQLRAALAAVEWGGTANGNCGFCPRCELYRDEGHAPDCIVGLALEVLPAPETRQ